MAAATITLSFPDDDIAALTLDMPDKGANILSQSVLQELDDHLTVLEKRDDLAGLIIRSGKPRMFIAGADLREFASSLDIEAEQTVAMCRRGQTLFQRLSKTPFVTVAAIGGICVGGGAELAIWCDRRIMADDPKTQYGFPEVKLGLMPGWGGTARTPRIVGLSNAVEMVTSGDSIDADAAVLMGLATQAVAADDLDVAAIGLVRAEQQSAEYVADRQTYDAPIDISDTELGFLGATASGYIQQKTAGNYPAPLAALEVMLGAAGADIDAACQMEADAMGGLFGSPVNRALLNVFFLTDRNKKDTGLGEGAATAGDINSVSVVGAGIMGQGIASAAVRRKVPATLTDVSTDALQAGVQKILEEVSYNKKTKGADVKRTVEFAPLLNATTAASEMAASDLVIEAVVERESVKKELYAKLEPLMADDAILATNTSTIPITKLAEGLKRPERFAGLHFFNPVRKMPLVVVIRGEQTSDETVATLVAYAKRIGKSPIVVNDGPGFLVNRLLLPYMSEAAQLLTEGAAPKAIDRAATKFGMPMGPLNLFDVVGLDTALYAGAVMKAAYPDRVIDPAIIPALVEAGRLGVKSGLGFYSYMNKKKRPQPDPAFDELLAPLVEDEDAEFNNADLKWRLFLPMFLEATRVLEDGLVRDARDVDLGLIFGIGYPPFKGGLLFGGDVLGAERIVEMLKPYVDLGPRYQPTELLLEKAKTGGKFYE